MRECCAWTIGLWLMALAGCATSLPEQTTALMPRWTSLESDSLQIEIGLLRQPVGEPYFNTEIWREVDELVLSLERRLTLEANGFRVGVISGNVPADLQQLLTNRKTCIASRRISLRPGHEHFLPLAPGEKDLVLQVVERGDTIAQDFAKAVCGLMLRFELAEDGEMVVKCEPCVRHGVEQRMVKPASDLSDWTMRSGRPEERYPGLAWEFSLSATEYGIVGGLLDRPQSLGYSSMTGDKDGESYQYLLVIRTVRPQVDSASALLQGADRQTGAEPPPLALQSIARPKRPPVSTRGQSP